MNRLSGKVALVTGAGLGMGASHARAIVAEGGNVVLGDILDAEGQALADELGDAAHFVHLDVRRSSDWDEAIADAERVFGRVNVLVNNAAILRLGGLTEVTDEDWNLIIEINLTGAVKGMRAVVPAMERAGGGSIINVSSTAGLKGFIGGFAYGVSKWGVRGMTKHGAMDLAAAGIRVNSIHPGNVHTRMLDGRRDDFEYVPLKRAGEPAELSALVVFLSSDESSFCTGAEFVADGGETTGIANLPRAEDPGPEAQRMPSSTRYKKIDG